MGLTPELREEVFKRDGYKCRYCGWRKTNLHPHHIVYRSKGGPDTLRNLITVCANCHRNIHDGFLIVDIDYGNDGSIAFIRREGFKF